MALEGSHDQGHLAWGRAGAAYRYVLRPGLWTWHADFPIFHESSPCTLDLVRITSSLQSRLAHRSGWIAHARVTCLLHSLWHLPVYEPPLSLIPRNISGRTGVKMSMKRAAIVAAAACSLTAAAFYFYLTGRFDVLHRRTSCTVEVNCRVVDGDVLLGRTSALVTRRDKGKEHSYLLLYAGDTDQTGDIGDVIDCHTWIAPNLPMLIAIENYRNCPTRPNSNQARISLRQQGSSEQC
jgi:hypothetical protein